MVLGGGAVYGTHNTIKAGWQLGVRFCAPPDTLRRRANVAHVRQSRPDSGPGFQVGGFSREQKMLKGYLPRVVYHRVYSVYEDQHLASELRVSE